MSFQENFLQLNTEKFASPHCRNTNNPNNRPNVSNNTNVLANQIENSNNTNSPQHTNVWTQHCPQHGDNYHPRGHYPVDVESNIPLELRSSGPNERIVAPQINAGLYGGPQSTRPWANIPVAPTATNLIHYNLRSANPPPGAIVHYPGGDRLGNNYTAMPGVYWYNPDHPQYANQYKIKIAETTPPN